MSFDSTEPAFDWGDRDEEDKPDSANESRRDSGSKGSRGQLAVFGGLYAVWSIAWVIAIAAAPAQPASSILDAVMYQFGEFLGLVATPVWIGAIWHLTSEGAGKSRPLLLILGVVVLFPLPLVLPVVMG